MSQVLRNFDLTIFHALNQWAGRNASLDRLMVFMADSYMINGILLISCVWYVWFQIPYEKRELLLREMAGAALAGPCSRGVQHLVPFHARPLHDPSSGVRLALGVDPNKLNHWSSFPSDHAAVYFALSGVVFLHCRRLGILAYIWTAILLLSRIYLGFHWPSDNVGGIIIGAVVVTLCRAMFPVRISSWLVSLEKPAPGYFYGIAFFLSYLVATLYTELRELVKALHWMLFK